MARRSTSAQTSAPRTVVTSVTQVLGEHRREVAWIGALAASTFALVALAGWNDTDPTWLRPDLSGQAVVANPCGPLGANLADVLYQALGLGAWGVAIQGGATSIYALAGRRLLTWGRWFVLAWLVTVLLAIAELGWGAPPDALWTPGGAVGVFVAVALVDVIGVVGAWIALTANALSAGSLLLGVSWSVAARRVVNTVESGVPVARRGAELGGRKVAQAGSAAMGAGWRGLIAGARGLGALSVSALVRLGDVVGAMIRGVWALVRGAGGRARAAFSRTALEDLDDTAWRELTGLERPESDHRSVASLSSLPDAAARLPGDVTEVNPDTLPEAEVVWDASQGEDVGDLLEMFPLLGPRKARRGTSRQPPTVPGVPTPTPVRPDDDIDDDLLPGSVPFERPPPAPAWSAPAPAGRAGDVAVQERPRPPAVVSVKPQPAPVAVAAAAVAPSPLDAPVVAPRPALAPVVAPAALAGPAAASAAGSATVVPLHDSDAFVEEEEEDDDEEVSGEPGVLHPRMRRDLQVEPAAGLESSSSDDGRSVSDHGSLYFELPTLSLLDPVPEQRAHIDKEELEALAATVEESLSHFKVTGEVTNVRVGPVVTIFEFLPDPGIKVRRIANLADDLAMALRARSVRVVAPIPGKGVVGIEIPSKHRMTIYLRELMASPEFRKSDAALPVVIGKDVEGRPVVEDLARMPHVLVGGTTGAGKSVGVNGFLLSLLFTRTPEELRLLLIDPKKLEFEAYNGVPHLLHPVVTEAAGASAALAWACREMDRRYEVLSNWQTRGIDSFNKKLEKELRGWNSEKAWKYAPKDWANDLPPPPPEPMPYIVIVIDELADLMMVAKKDVQDSIVRLAQMARACGMHLVVATQRPSVDVVTGLIKSNMPTRISFKLRSVVDSRTILDQGGAEKLLGRGDLLLLPGAGEPRRCHGAFVSDDEVSRVIAFLCAQREPEYLEGVLDAAPGGGDDGDGYADPEMDDDMYDQALALVVERGKASTSMVQRHLKIGYNRAARLIDAMEAAGVVGPADGARPRQVLIGPHAG